jgi:hypothetical protein
MIIFIATYYVIGVLVSLYFIHYYRLSEKTKTQPKASDGIGAIIGPWVFPLQIIKHVMDRLNKRSNKNDA